MSAELDDLLQQFRRLVEENSEDVAPAEAPEANNFRCVDCVDCTQCRFCTNCERCDDCTYCEDSIDCRSCTQGRGLFECAHCTQATHSAYCESSSYLVLCYGCRECVHCFACVGLEGAEFCVLNEQLSRRDYFQRVARLRGELDEAHGRGWSPPWLNEEEPSEAGSGRVSDGARDASSTAAASEPDEERPWRPIIPDERAPRAGDVSPGRSEDGRAWWDDGTRQPGLEDADELWSAFDLPAEDGATPRHPVEGESASTSRGVARFAVVSPPRAERDRVLAEAPRAVEDERRSRRFLRDDAMPDGVRQSSRPRGGGSPSAGGERFGRNTPETPAGPPRRRFEDAAVDASDGGAAKRFAPRDRSAAPSAGAPKPQGERSPERGMPKDGGQGSGRK